MIEKHTPQISKPPEEQEPQGRWEYSRTEYDGNGDEYILYKCPLCGEEQGLSDGLHWCPSCQKRLARYEPAAEHEEVRPDPAAEGQQLTDCGDLIRRDDVAKTIINFTAAICAEYEEDELRVKGFSMGCLAALCTVPTVCNPETIIRELEAHKYWHAAEIVRKGAHITAASKKE